MTTIDTRLLTMLEVRVRPVAFVLLGLTSFSTGVSAAPADDPADVVLTGGPVITLDDSDRVARAIAVRGRHILAVGSEAEIQRLTGPSTRVVELRGRAVTPGFIDAHTHVEHTAVFENFYLSIHSPPLPSTDAILEKLRERAATAPPGTWIVGQGTFGQPMPSREELDREFPDHPVVLRWSRHDYIVNANALELSDITSATPPPRGGKIEHDADGNPTGILREAFDLLRIPPYPEEEMKAALEKTLRDIFMKQGVTSVYDMPGHQAIPLYQSLYEEGRLPVRLRVTYTVHTGSQAQIDIDSLIGTGIRTGFGNDWLRVGGIKLFVDGAGPSAATYEQPGLLRRDEALLEEHVRKAHEAGWQLLIHAIGDRAQDMTLDALETVLSESPREDHRHRIEHLGNTLDVARLDRAQRLGVIPVPTAAGIWSTRDERARQTDGPPRRPYRSLIARGFRPPGNSDTAGTRTYAINPMLNVSWLVTRRNRNGVVVQPEDESLSVLDALRVQSLFGAYAGFEENVKGSLEPGKLADLVVLSEDPLEAAPERLADIVMDLTMIDGVVRYERR